MDFDTSVIKPVREEALNIVRIILKKKLTKIEDIFKYINNPKKRSRLFDSLNMMISLQGFNCEILKFLKKKNKIKNFINWTYPQIRLDGGFAKKFASPLHSDQWILDKNKNGIIVWTSLNENGSSLLIAKNKKIKKLKRHSYWGIESLDKIEMEKVYVNYGQILIFDKKVFHKTPPDENRITVQLRYEKIDQNFKTRTINQVVDPKIRKYWFKSIKK